ncbi:MAG TPA: hypothetical protein VF762_10670 [Blastocatellia bacterium]|jgi:hypothetical protein
MPLDHSKATVTVSVAGIALSCINKRERDRCEISILKCDRHRLTFDIQKIELHPRTLEPVRSCLIPHSLSLDDDIAITLAQPLSDEFINCERGTSKYMGREFDRLRDIGDEEDFRWIADLEGPEFHNHKLKTINRYKIKPTIFITDGILYTRQKTDEVFARVSADGGTSPVALGRLAHGINADIACVDGGAVMISNVYDRGVPDAARCPSVRLPKDDLSRYRITIENHCRLQDDSEGTDFRLFYDVLKDPDGKRYDLRRMVETGPYGRPEQVIEDRRNLSLDGYPQNCLVADTSISNTHKS